MPIGPHCAIEIGLHAEPFWIDKNTDMMVCDRHKEQYSERASDLGPFDWEEISIVEIFESTRQNEENDAS